MTNLKQEPKNTKIQFLIDKPVTSDGKGNIKFGHEDIARTIVECTKLAKSSLTVGLFGDWGSGKSTIVSEVTRKLQEDSIPSIVFDVWKHSHDALRRTFLMELMVQLKKQNEIDPDFEIDPQITNSSQSSINNPPGKHLWDNLKNSKWFHYLLFIIGFVLITAIIVLSYLNRDKVSALVLLQVFLSIFVALLTYLNTNWLSLLSKSLSLSVPEGIKSMLELFVPSSTKTIIFDRFSDPHQFETEFKKILSKMKSEKILISFDNLDRVEGKQMLAVLTTIKTFLEPEFQNQSNVRTLVYLIPCDDRVLKNNISNHYQEDNVSIDSDEYLRKFFNTSIRIPRFMQSELELFTKNKLQQTGVKELENDHVSWIITKSFRENPRQIIQFINHLVATYLLIIKRLGKDLPDDFLHNNIPQLAKYLILQQKYPQHIQQLLKANILTLSISEVDEVKELDNKEPLLQFLKETEKEIPIQNLQLLSMLRRSSFERSFEGIDKLFSMMEDNRFEEAIKQFTRIKKLSNFDVNNFSIIVKERLTSLSNTTTISTFITALLKLLEKEKIKLTETTYSEISKILESYEIFIGLDIKPNTLTMQLSHVSEDTVATLVGHWARYLVEITEGKIKEYNVDDVKLILREVEHNKDRINDIPKLRTAFSGEFLLKEPELMLYIVKNKELQNLLISPEFTKHIVASLPKEINNISILESSIDIFNLLDIKIVTNNSLENIFTTVLAISQNIQIIPVNEDSTEKEGRFCNIFEEFLSTWTHSNKDISDILIDSLVANVSRIPNQDQRSPYISLFIIILSIIEESRHTKVIPVVNEFLNSAKPAVIEMFYDKKGNRFVKEDFINTLNNRAVNNQEFWDYYFNKVDNRDSRNNLMIALLAHDINRLLRTIEDKKIYKDLKEDIIIQLLGKLQLDGQPINIDIFSTCAHSLKKTYMSAKNLLADKILQYLKRQEPEIQEIGLKGYDLSQNIFAKQKIREISKSLFDWIKNDTLVPNKYQPFALTVIAKTSTQYNQTEKATLIQFIFDELLRKPNTIEMIQLGFNLLVMLDVSYTNNSENFEDIKSKYLNSDDQIKLVIKNGLDLVKSDKGSKKAKAFYTWVSELE